MPTTRPVLANAGAMSQFIGEFEVESRLSGHKYTCRFSHMWNGIATRHADTIDTKSHAVEIVTAKGKRETLLYDRLVMATGSRLFRPNIPGLAEHAFSVDQLATRSPRRARTVSAYSANRNAVSRDVHPPLSSSDWGRSQ